MNSTSVTIAVESVRRFASLGPLGNALALVYVSLSAAIAYGGYWDYQQSVERQPDRIPYSMVMFASFALLFILAAIRAWQAATLLNRLYTQPSAANLEAAIAKTRDMLLLFFVWLILTLLGFIGFAFFPAY